MDVTEEGADWKLSVQDNGPGIAVEYHQRIFKMFETLASRDELENSGVGLAVAKRIVEMEGGRIWVESKLGKGSAFFFTWPKGPNAGTHQEEKTNEL